MSITSLIATFNGVSFTSIPGVSVLATDPYKAPRRSLAQFLLARQNKRNTNSAFYTAKEITIRVGIHGATRGDAEQKHDSLLAILQGLKKELVVSQGSGVRRYFCTFADIKYILTGGSYMEFDLIFSCDDSFGYDTAYTTALNLSNISSSTRGDQLEFKGSAPWQAPLIVLTYSAVSGDTSESVIVGNPDTGQSVTVTRNWQTGDRLEICGGGVDGDEMVEPYVKVNGVEVDFDGAIPLWAPQVGNWSYSDTLSSRTFNALITYYKRSI